MPMAIQNTWAQRVAASESPFKMGFRSYQPAQRKHFGSASRALKRGVISNKFQKLRSNKDAKITTTTYLLRSFQFQFGRHPTPKVTITARPTAVLQTLQRHQSPHTNRTKHTQRPPVHAIPNSPRPPTPNKPNPPMILSNPKPRPIPENHPDPNAPAENPTVGRSH